MMTAACSTRCQAGGVNEDRAGDADEPYRIPVEEIPDGVAVLTTGGDILYANARFAAMVGEPLESVIGSKLARFMPTAGTSPFVPLLKEGRGRARGRLADATGDEFEVALAVSTTSSPGAERVNVIVTDLSDLAAAEAARDRSLRDSRTKDEFLAMLAHELRSPLQAISAAAGVLAHAAQGGAPRAHDAIKRQITHLSQIVADLLDVERVVSGKLRLNRRPLDLSVAVLQEMAHFTADSRYDWHIEVGSVPLWVEVDTVRLLQMLSNLVTNAVKYTPSGGRISVTLQADGADVVLSVADTGLGISPRLLPHIFDLYTQADRTLTHAEGGLGIGLTLVRRLAELHGGTVAVASAGEGCGSTFTIRLNRIPPVQDTGPAALTDRRASGRRVLLIQDNAEAREMLRTVLELAGHEVYTAANGAAALGLLNVVRPDVGIIDIDLPIMDGYEIADRIRRSPGGDEIVLIALNGDDAADGVQQRGFDRQLAMALDADTLTRLLREDVARQ